MCTQQCQGRWAQLLLAAAVLCLALHAVSAAGNHADSSMSDSSEEESVFVNQPINPIVTVATISRGNRRPPKRPRRPAMTRRAGSREVVITTSNNEGAGKEKLGLRARLQQALQKLQPAEQQQVPQQEQELVQHEAENLLQEAQQHSENEQTKTLSKGASKAATSSASSKKKAGHTTAKSNGAAAKKSTGIKSGAASRHAAKQTAAEDVHDPSAASDNKPTAAPGSPLPREQAAAEGEGEPNDSQATAGASGVLGDNTGSTASTDSANSSEGAFEFSEGDDGDAAVAGAHEEMEAGLEADANAGSTQQSSKGSKSSKTGIQKATSKTSVNAEGLQKAGASLPKPKWAVKAQPDLDDPAAEDEEDEAEAEAEDNEGYAEVDTTSEEQQGTAGMASEDESNDADSQADADIRPRQHASNSQGKDSSRAKAAGSGKTSGPQAATGKLDSKAQGSTKHKDTQKAGSTNAGAATSGDAASSHADLATQASDGGSNDSNQNITTTAISSSSLMQPADSDDGMPWTLTGRSHTISLAAPEQTGSVDGEESRAAADSAMNATSALASVAAAATQKSTANISSALGPISQPSTGVQGSSNSLLSAASSKATAGSPQSTTPAPSPAAFNVDDDGLMLLDEDSAEDIAAADFDATASAMGLKGTKGSSSSSTSVAVAALLSSPSQGAVQPVLGGASAGLLRQSMEHVALMREVVFKLASKPNLLQYIQQKQIRQVADTLDATDVAEIGAIPGLLGLPAIYRAGDDDDSQLYAKKTAIAVAMTLFSHLTADQAVTIAGMLIPGYVTPGLTFEQLNKRLYDAGINTQLDEIFDAVMAAKSNTQPNSKIAEGSIESEEVTEGRPAGRAMSVAKSAKVAGFLVLALLLQARVLLCGF